MALTPGTRLGPYEVTAQIGVGGMGEVYQATDTRLDRIVAIKVSKSEFSERFEREARTIARLNHPHVCQLFDVGSNYLVMEFVDGIPLAGPLPLRRVVEYAAQMLDALDAAHRLKIVHRDLKPANILVTRHGIKLLDFGLAKLQTELTAIDGVTEAVTATGTVVGTLQYMAPEQLQGKGDVDQRADIFSFGCVLYEMLSGKRAFDGSDAASIIAAIMEREPAPLEAPSHLAWVITTCLAKSPDDRFQTTRDLKRLLAGTPVESAGRPAPSWKRYASLGAVAGATLAALVAVAFRPTPESALEIPALRFQLPAPADVTLLRGAVLSPGGERIVFLTASGSSGRANLWIRELDSLDMKVVSGVPPSVSAATPPFWSPDGRQIAFWDGADRKIKRIPIAGGVPQPVCDALNYAGGAWAPDGTIVFGTRGAGLFRVAAGGATPVALTQLDSQETGHINPTVVPDGSHVVYHAVGEDPTRPIYLAAIKGGTRTLLASGATGGDEGGALYATPGAASASGHLLFKRGSALVARPLDPRTFQPNGEEFGVADGVSIFSIAGNGMLAYRTGGVVQPNGTRLVWMDRAGKHVGQLGAPGSFADVDLSPDGSRVVVSQRDLNLGAYDLWIIDVARGVPSRFTFEASDDRFATWSADGTWIAYASGVGRAHSVIYKRVVGGTAPPEILIDQGNDFLAADVSPDGQFLLYRDTNAKGGLDALALPLTTPREQRRPVPYLHTTFNEQPGRFSPGAQTRARWVAYVSDESGKPEVYVQSFPSGAGKLQISNGGGLYPRWRADGKELFYLAADRKLIAVEITLAPALAVVATRPLFDLDTSVGGIAASPYDVSRDGRFLVIAPTDTPGQTPAPQITVVTNWQRALKP